MFSRAARHSLFFAIALATTLLPLLLLTYRVPSQQVGERNGTISAHQSTHFTPPLVDFGLGKHTLMNPRYMPSWTRMSRASSFTMTDPFRSLRFDRERVAMTEAANVDPLASLTICPNCTEHRLSTDRTQKMAMSSCAEYAAPSTLLKTWFCGGGGGEVGVPM